ncbi:MAG: hypothetical protein QOG09_1588 [Solirubrobacterales bacterium]|jgi:hypothetical protein|nr:hypothetical protein [Solirubrobacterales bacterium]
MRKGFSRKHKAVAALAAVVAVIGASLVYAAWLATGTGSGYAKAGSAQALSTVDVSASTAATLYPGGSGDVLIKVSNPNSYPIRVTGIALNGSNSSIAADSGHSGCTTTGVSFSDQTGLSVDVPAKSGGVNGTVQTTLSGAAAMSNASLDACQGATFTIPVSLSGSSNA